jgi:hypothetical protein
LAPLKAAVNSGATRFNRQQDNKATTTTASLVASLSLNGKKVRAFRRRMMLGQREIHSSEVKTIKS